MNELILEICNIIYYEDLHLIRLIPLFIEIIFLFVIFVHHEKAAKREKTMNAKKYYIKLIGNINCLKKPLTWFSTSTCYRYEDDRKGLHKQQELCTVDYRWVISNSLELQSLTIVVDKNRAKHENFIIKLTLQLCI